MKKKAINVDKKKAALLERANEGNHAAQFEVSMAYRHGKNGFEENDAASFEWLKRSSDNGNYKAHMSLAYLYRNGEHVNQDFEEASRYYLRAEKLGILRARELRLKMQDKENMR